MLATGLSGLYSSLPARLEVYSEGWHSLQSADWLQVPSLIHFLHSLQFCSTVSQVHVPPSLMHTEITYSHTENTNTYTHVIYTLYLVLCITPKKDIDAKSVLRSVFIHTKMSGRAWKHKLDLTVASDYLKWPCNTSSLHWQILSDPSVWPLWQCCSAFHCLC